MPTFAHLTTPATSQSFSSFSRPLPDPPKAPNFSRNSNSSIILAPLSPSSAPSFSNLQQNILYSSELPTLISSSSPSLSQHQTNGSSIVHMPASTRLPVRSNNFNLNHGNNNINNHLIDWNNLNNNNNNMEVSENERKEQLSKLILSMYNKPLQHPPQNGSLCGTPLASPTGLQLQVSTMNPQVSFSFSS